MIKTAIILAGGFGTRLKSVLSDLPKPMAPVCGKPFLEYLLLYLKNYEVDEVILSTGHLSEKIIEHFGEEFQGMKIKYSHEETPLGTGGAIRLALANTQATQVFVMNGDSFFDVDLFEFYREHVESRSQISLALRYAENASRYGNIVLNDQQTILEFKEKNEKTTPGLINGGVYIFEKSIFMTNTPAEKKFSVEQDFFSAQCGKLQMKGFEFRSYFIDIGIPEDYNRAQSEFKSFKYR